MTATASHPTRPLTALEDDELDATIRALLVLIQAKYQSLAEAQRHRALRLTDDTHLNRLRSELHTLEQRYEQALQTKRQRNI